MKKQINPTIKAHLIRGAFYLLLLLAVCAIPFALGQRHKASAGKQTASASASGKALAQARSPHRTGVTQPAPYDVRALPPQAPKYPYSSVRDRRTSQVPQRTSGPLAAHVLVPPPRPKAPQVVLYDQYNNNGSNATLSATFTDFPTFSADLADDFVVPGGQTWNVESIDADGVYFNGPGPAINWNVFIYANSGTLPGAPVYSTLNQPVTQVGTTFTVNLTPAAVLPAGTYWIEIQANLTFNPNGEWGWTDRTVLSNNPAAWQNPGGGFGVCPTWAPKLAVCVPTASGPDQVYRINGTTGGGGTPTPTPTGSPAGCTDYTTSTGTGTITPGDTDTGSHCDDCDTAISFPFPVSVYGQTFNSANVSSNGALNLVGTAPFFTHGCLALPDPNWNTAIFPYQDDLRTDNLGFAGCTGFPGGTCGIFTSVTGTAPNRQFNIEWRVVHFADTAASANFSLVFYESQSSFWDVFYGATSDNGLDETSGVQASPAGPATTFSCGTATLTNGLKVTYTCAGGGGSPTPTPTCTPGAGGMLIGSTITVGYPPHNYTTLANNLVNYTFSTGQTAPNDFALFQTHDPWGGTVVETAITGAGHTFTVFTPAQLAGFPFSDYRVIVLNWDDTFLSDFLANYTAAIPALEAYINAGGVVWVQGALQGSPGDSYPFPFGGQANYDTQPVDRIVDFASPIVAGVPDPIEGNSASHADDSGLPGGAHVVVAAIDVSGPPTIYELRPGGGCGPSPTPTATATGTPGGCTVNGVIDGNDPTENGRLFRDEPASSCGAVQPCAVSGAGMPFHYDSYNYTNTTGSSQCVTVTLDPMTCVGTNYLNSGAYLGTFDPNNPCANYLADIGNSPDVAKSYSFDVADGQTIVVVVNESFSNAGCVGYQLTVDGICGGGGSPTPTASPSATPTATATGTPSATPTCPPGNSYTIAEIGGSIVPGTTDIGNHGDDTVTTVALPFSYTLYDQTFTSINLSSNGNAQFTTTDATFSNVCLAWPTHDYSIYPYWDDLYLVNSGFGIFTSVSGTAPNRIFNIEWRAQYFPGSGNAGFELRLYEGQTRFDVIYGTVSGANTSATAGVQKNDTTFTQYLCNGTGGGATGGQSYTLQGCGTPTPTPTATASCTPSSFHVLIVYADTAAPSQLQSEILAEPGVAAVDLFDAQAGTPTLGQLQQYQIVVPYSNFPFLDGDTLGNNLADYVDGGGVVVQYGFSHYGPGQPYGVNGRWVSGNYNPYDYSTNIQFNAFSLGTFNAGHPLMAGVTMLNSDFENVVFPAAGATEVAQDSFANSLVAYRPVSGGHTTVGVTAYVGSDATQSGDWGKVIVNAGRWLISGPCGTPSPTPTASGTCVPGGSPGPWTQAAPVAIDHYGGFMDSDGTFAYEGGGYSFSAADNINQFGKFNPATNTWTPLAPVPDLNNGEASGVYAPNVNKLFVFGGENVATATVVNTTRIYDIATNTWSTGAPMPDVRAFMGSGYFNGKIYLVGGYSTGNVDPSFGQVWEYDPVLNTFDTTRMSMPATLGGPGFGIINGHMYIAGGRDINNTNLNTLYDYDIAANTWTTRANMPSGVNVPGSAVVAGKLWVFGGGNPFTGPSTMPTSGKTGVRAWLKRMLRPDTTNSLQVYDPATNSWTNGPTLGQQRSFPAGTAVGNTAVAVGGYTGSNTTTSVEVNVTGGGCASPTPTVPPTATPTASPSCTPGGTPGPWTIASPYPIPDVRYGFAQTATHFYVFGGVSNGTRVSDVNRMDIATGMWQPRAAMPFTSEAPTCALMASTGIVYCTEGDTGSGFASYNTATDTWTPLASIPGGDHYGSASGAFNGKVFVAGGTTGFVSAVQVYDVATNMWSAGTAAPNDFLLAGYQQVGQFLYVVGGFEASGPDAAAQSSVLNRGRQSKQPKASLSSMLNRGQQSKQPEVPMANNTTTWRLDMSSAPGVWTVGPAFTAGRADFGLAYDAGTNKLYALGGDLPGGGFFDSTTAVDELSVASWPAGSWMPSPPNLILPNRQANQAGFYGAGQIWSVGGLEGQTFQFLAEVQRRSNGGGPCGTPTATPTATATFTPTATATATFTPTATATATATTTATATATATATVSPRATPTPRPRPTPPGHPSNCFLESSDCTGFAQTLTLTCFDCLVTQGGMSWQDGAGCHTTCP